MDTNIIERLRAYANGECSPREAEEIRIFLAENPQKIIELINYMRNNAMNKLGIDSASDPFRQVVADAIKMSSKKIANASLHASIMQFFSEKNFDENVPTAKIPRNDSENNKKPTDMKTIDFTSQEFQAINASAAKMMDSIDPNKSTLSNMVAQLLIQFPSLSVDAATAACRKLTTGVCNFSEVYKMLQDQDASVDTMVDTVYNKCIAAIADKTAQEQAAILTNFIAYAKYVDAANLGLALSDESATKTFEQLLAENQCVNGEITDEVLDQLKAQLKDAIKSSSIVLTQEESLRALISAAEGGASLTEELAKKNLSDVDFKAYAALAAYVACLKGEVSGCDENVEPEVLGASVAAGVERMKVMADAKAGRISWEKALKYLKWIGGALLYGLFAWVTYNLLLLLFGGTAIITLALLGTSFAACAAGFILGAYVAFKGTNWFVDSVAKPIIDGAGEAYDKVINALTSGAVLDYIKKSYNATVAFFKSVWGYITGAFHAGTTTVASPI